MMVRREKNEDIPSIFKLNIESFSTDAEANLVDMLRNRSLPMISCVAEEAGNIVGHILFTPVTLIDQNPAVALAGLGPMAVLPAYRKKGVGTLLVEFGLEECRKEGYGAVVVLGHADYYPRFGFVPSVAYGIASNYDVPPELFMIMELKKGALKGLQGIIAYHELFNDV
ncbi:N-acetyltransferase [Desulfatiferula olefinivorans]